MRAEDGKQEINLEWPYTLLRPTWRKVEGASGRLVTVGSCFIRCSPTRYTYQAISQDSVNTYSFFYNLYLFHTSQLQVLILNFALQCKIN